MKPYPAEWERHDVLRDGRRVFVRPLKPEDIAFYPDFLAHVTAEDLRLRFFAPVNELSPAVLDRLTHLDYARAMAFIAFDQTTREMLGVVRLHRDEAGAGGEYAVLVRSALKGHGLGWLLMSRMIEYARREGITDIHGQVLAENTTMLTMCTELGFTVGDDPAGGGRQGGTPRPRLAGSRAALAIRTGDALGAEPEGTLWQARHCMETAVSIEAEVRSLSGKI